jgi:tRNA A37 threonylcarbamoyladenosine synthetase subunit TsaC/SUA5/YrdC
MMYVKMDQSGNDLGKLDPVIELIKEGAVGVIPTDTVYV